MNDEYGFRKELKDRDIAYLIDRFNKEVGNMGWVRARGFFLSALSEAFLASGFDCSDFIAKNGALNLQYPIQLVGKCIVNKREKSLPAT